ncbi:MAG TPA: aldehyde dehydrogenase family protein [Limnobacter sp.]|uniref:aldehyde dehydrogenase family protein n=1 Tax=Limnobacter sp. TaxID=2003368 RepID=UPI002ED77258
MNLADSKALAQTVGTNPATGQALGALVNTPIEQMPAIFESARQAQALWGELSFRQRARHIRKMREYIVNNADRLAGIVSQSSGKTFMDALTTEVLPCTLACNWYSKNAAKVLKPQRREASSIIWIGKRSLVTHEPLGVVAIISPWNYPLSIPFGEIVMGLMAGNAILLKVAAATPMVGKAIEEIVAAGELPQGLFHHIVGPGADISTAFFNHGVDKIFFTGSVPAGKDLMAQAAKTLTPLSLELGGKDPMIVLEDADLERAAAGAAWAGFQNSGQSCAGVERIYVHASVYDRFVALLSEKTRALRQGVPNAQCTVDVGAMTTAKQRRLVERHVEEAVAAGAKIEAQAQLQAGLQGEFFPATVLTNVNHNMAVMREETFGPVLPVMKFNTLDEAVALANDCTMALSASIWTRDTAKGKALAKRVRGGVVVINDHLYTHGMSDLPWGGPGESGIGRTHGPEGLIEMSRLKAINWDLLRARRNLWWYPQDRATYNVLKHAIRLGSPRSIGEFLLSAARVVPYMIKRMYF